MKIIKIEVNRIKPNPFKKFINKGKLDRDIVDKLIEGYKQTTFHENLCARENSEREIELVYGHHRLEAVKIVYGKKHKINLRVYSLKEFSDEQMLLDMIRENMTQRGEDYRDMADCIMLAKGWLEGKIRCKPALHLRKQDISQGIGARQIADFLSKQGKSISHVQVEKYVAIEEKLHPDLKKKVERGTRAGQLEDNKIGFEVASEIAKFDKSEQKILNEEISKAEVNKDKAKKLLADYKNSPEELKNKVKKGEIDLTEIPIEKFKSEIKQKAEEELKNKEGKIKITFIKKYQRQAGNNIGETNEKILKTCAFFDALEKQGVLYELDWNTMYRIIEAGHTGGKRYSKFMEMIMNKL